MMDNYNLHVRDYQEYNNLSTHDYNVTYLFL